MPPNKAGHKRLEFIDECLRNTARRWYKAELLEQVNKKLQDHFGDNAAISESQLRNDLNTLELDYMAPLEAVKEGKKVYYRYEDPTFSIKNISLKEEEIAALNETERLFRELGLPIAEYFSSIVRKVVHKSTLGHHEQRVIYTEGLNFEGFEHMADLYQAIIRKNVLKIIYKKLHAAHTDEYLVHPYAVKEYIGRWYLWCYSEERHAPRTLALDRIRDMRVMGLPYRENTFISIEDYFKHVIGVTVYPDSRPEDIALWFSPDVAPLIETKPLHPSQFIENNDRTGLFIKIQVVINPELISTILSYGNDARVIAPEPLKKIVKGKILEMCDHY